MLQSMNTWAARRCRRAGLPTHVTLDVSGS